MIVLRCTTKLRKRLRLPNQLQEPASAPTNPLGEWYADIDFYDRQPFLVLMNWTTGVCQVLPGRAQHLRELQFYASEQLFKLFLHFGLDLNDTLAGEELAAWDAPSGLVYAKARDRSLLGSLNRAKEETWIYFAYQDGSLLDAAARQWDGLFRHPSLVPPGGNPKRHGWHRPVELLQLRLCSPQDARPAH